MVEATVAAVEAHAQTPRGVRACPICGSLPRGLAFPYETIWQGKTFWYRGCAECGTTFVDPVPSDAELRTIYSWSNYHARHFTEWAPDRFRCSLGFLARHAGSRRTLLDFGCGDGSFLAAASEAGYTCEGVEYEPSVIEQARARSGLPVCSLDAVAQRGTRFDIVHASDVIPHLAEPVAILRTLDGLLAPDGVLFIEGPLENNASLVRYATTPVKRLRRRIGMDAPSTTPPTMLMRLTRSGQKDWFTKRLGYTSLAFEIYETGWPYYVPGRSLRSIAGCAKQAIGALAIVAARLQKAESRRLGNRFMAILAAPARS